MSYILDALRRAVAGVGVGAEVQLPQWREFAPGGSLGPLRSRQHGNGIEGR